jgi:hypothetical protein
MTGDRQLDIYISSFKKKHTLKPEKSEIRGIEKHMVIKKFFSKMILVISS